VRVLALATALALPGCFGGCEPGTPEPEPVCLDARAPPPDGEEVAQVGVVVDGALVPLDEVGPLPLERGPQGGQHFYVDIDRYARTDPRWSHALTLLDPEGRTIGEASAFAEGCAPGWVRTERVAFPVRSSTVTGGTVRMRSSALDEGYAPIRSLPELLTSVELSGS
jgi:hypothetical protein